MPDPMAIATIVGGAMSAGSALLAQRRANEHNKAERELAYQRQLQAVREQNQYNDPASQVARLRASGLNPNLAYGAEGATVGNQDATPEYSPADYQSGIAPAGADAAQMITSLVGLREQKNRNLLAVAEYASKSASAFASAMAGNLSSAEAFETLALLGYKRDKLDMEIRKGENEIVKIGEEFLNLQAQRDEIRSRIGLNEQQIKTLCGEYDLSEMQAYYIWSKMPHEFANMDADTAYKYVASAEGRARIEQISEETAYISFYAGLENRKVLLGENQYFLDKDKFNFHKENEFKFQVQAWQKERQQEALFRVGDWASRIAGFLVGGAAMGRASGSVQRQPSPIITPSGGSFDGWHYAQ